MNKPAAVVATLGEVIGLATDYYLAFDLANNTHAGITIKQETPIQFNVFVTHADHQHQLLAVAVRDGLGEWGVTFMDLTNPQWLVIQERNQGFGVARYSYQTAEQLFREYAKAHHADETVTFVKSSPGRTVVRRAVVVDDRTLSAVPFGVILDARVIRGERIFAQDTEQNPRYGIDIYG